MNIIKPYITELNKKKKVLSVFLTAGYPTKEMFLELAIQILREDADLLEIGIPFSDPLADGNVIQASSHAALQNGITLKDVFSLSEKIKSKIDKPLIMMGYANPILKYGMKDFMEDSANAGVSGLIVPDVPLEEYDNFYKNENQLDVILLTTPTSNTERVKRIDGKSKGFVYCVSITGTTGASHRFNKETIANIERTYKNITSNKMFIGFGISSVEDIKQFKPYCDGVIVGSAIISKINTSEDLSIITNYVHSLNQATLIE